MKHGGTFHRTKYNKVTNWLNFSCQKPDTWTRSEHESE